MNTDDKFLAAIRSGHTRFRAKFAKRDNAEGTAPEWGPALDVEFYVKLREKPLRLRGGRVFPAGEILTFSPKDFGWAEYGEANHYLGPDWPGLFMAEEYRMQLLEVI